MYSNKDLITTTESFFLDPNDAAEQQFLAQLFGLAKSIESETHTNEYTEEHNPILAKVKKKFKVSKLNLFDENIEKVYLKLSERHNRTITEFSQTCCATLSKDSEAKNVQVAEISLLAYMLDQVRKIFPQESGYYRGLDLKIERNIRKENDDIAAIMDIIPKMPISKKYYFPNQNFSQVAKMLYSFGIKKITTENYRAIVKYVLRDATEVHFFTGFFICCSRGKFPATINLNKLQESLEQYQSQSEPVLKKSL